MYGKIVRTATRMTYISDCNIGGAFMTSARILYTKKQIALKIKVLTTRPVLKCICNKLLQTHQIVYLIIT